MVADGQSLRIYYSGNNLSHYFDCWATRWDEGNWDVTVETFLGSSNRNLLFSHMTPGAVSEMYNILGTPTYWDVTFNSGATLILEPQSGYGLSSLRQKRVVGVKNMSDTFLSPDLFSIKLECLRLDT